MKKSFFKSISGAILCVAILMGLSGCAHYTVNPPKTADSEKGYYFRNHHRENNSEEILFLLAFSGGGTRAASFSYGLLEALRDTTFEVDGQPRRLLDEIDIISSVSGGSFTAAAYGLYGDRVFEEFEPAFLNRNVQRTLVLMAFNPIHWPMLASSTYNWSEMAEKYYDKILFKGATFNDIATNNSPYLIINSTDISSGTRISFNQEFFDIFAADVGNFPIARAVAASSAVPGLLSPVVINNYAGEYPVSLPLWLQRNYTIETGVARTKAHRFKAYRNEPHPYIHLVDGGVSDNLGLRLYMDAISVLKANQFLMEKAPGLLKARKVVLIAVNSFVHHDKGWDESPKNIGTVSVAVASSARTMERYSEDTLLSFLELIQNYKQQHHLEDKMELYTIAVDFTKVKDPGKIKYLLNLPTSFFLKSSVVTELKETARTVLYQNDDFQRLMHDLGAEHPELKDSEPIAK